MTQTTSIRLTDEEKQQAMQKAEAYGLRSLAALIRFAIQQLKHPPKR